MKEKWQKYDYILALIFVLGSLSIIQLLLWPAQKKAESVNFIVEVSAPITAEVTQEGMGAINELYFSNSEKPVKVVSILPGLDGKKIITFEGSGASQDSGVIFAGQKIGLNQRVRIHGALEARGYVVGIKKTDQ